MAFSDPSADREEEHSRNEAALDDLHPLQMNDPVALYLAQEIGFNVPGGPITLEDLTDEQRERLAEIKRRAKEKRAAREE